MMTIRRASDRFHTRLSWLDSRHTFSFGGHYHPEHQGFRALRVMNDDRVKPGAGFGTHGHRDIEILSYVLDGALEHKDSMGNGSVVRPGEVQRMSAGTGVRHSEFNPLQAAQTRFLQVWLEPERRGIEPSYEQKSFAHQQADGQLQLVASRDGRQGSLRVHQDVDVWSARLSEGESTTFTVRPGRGVWVQVARGEISINGTTLSEGDGMAVENILNIDDRRTARRSAVVRPGVNPVTIMKKTAFAEHIIHPLLRERWSPRAFAARAIEPQALRSLFRSGPLGAVVHERAAMALHRCDSSGWGCLRTARVLPCGGQPEVGERRRSASVCRSEDDVRQQWQAVRSRLARRRACGGADDVSGHGARTLRPTRWQASIPTSPGIDCGSRMGSSR